MDRKIHPAEIVAILAMLMATVAFAIDSLLPAMSDIAAELSPDNFNNVQLIISGMMVGMGIGTLIVGPLSDALGRKPVVVGCAAVYITGSLVAWQTSSMEMLVLGRFIQGLGAAGPRVLTLSIVRDLYSGRQMARLVSFIMMVFTIFPAMAPIVGQWIIAIGGWRSIFLAFVIFSLVSVSLLLFRIPEPLPKERRQPVSLARMRHAVGEMWATPMVRMTTLVQMLIVSSMFTTISLIEPAFHHVFGLGDSFPYWFAGIGLFCATGSMLNAATVVKYGMRKIITVALTVSVIISAAMLVIQFAGVSGLPYFIAYLIWQTTVYYQMGLTMGNLNALAMEPLGHVAGLAASVIGAVTTVTGAVVSAIVTRFYDGSILPQVLASFIFCGVALIIMVRVRKLERHSDTGPTDEAAA